MSELLFWLGESIPQIEARHERARKLHSRNPTGLGSFVAPDKPKALTLNPKPLSPTVLSPKRHYYHCSPFSTRTTRLQSKRPSQKLAYKVVQGSLEPALRRSLQGPEPEALER